MNKNNNISCITGTIIIREICKKTGNVINEFVDENVITELGINTMFLRATKDDPDETMKLSNFVLGIDTGDTEDSSQEWDQFNPRPAQKTFTSLNQFSVYDVPVSDMVIDFPDKNKLQAGTLLDGEYILNTYFPDQVDLRYTSTTFRFFNDTTFSYKRFPVRSLSRLIDVQIVWTFNFENAKEYVCPLPEFNAERFTYFVDAGVLHRATDSLEASTTGLDVGDFSVLPNGEVYTLNATRVDIYNQSLERLDQFAVSSSSLIDVHPNGMVVVAGGSRVSCYIDKNHQWTSSFDESVNSIWIVNQNQILVSYGESIATISTKNGIVLYLNKFDSIPIPVSTIEGELFTVLGENDNAFVELLFDLSELSRKSVTSGSSAVTNYHDNDLIHSDGSFVIRVNADLDFIWSCDIGEKVKSISVDRLRNVYVLGVSKLYRINFDGSIASSVSVNTDGKIGTVGSRWGLTD